ncbi:expressed unknown protein [Ectocarpus siliculosus]|uniref:Uncharacterized protein n=1 Tax=Ectocarpus siliculosus TaxID=2880 RepID=D8LNT1_ECTSI|nr:expressed unknown protein [Ectocarpus siliculosus]|eukprot:CBN78291.1 expressed unknown protein [Ectocarpus siliculosus]
MEDIHRVEGFQLRRDANFLLNSDRCLTAVGAPVVLSRNFAGYASLGRPRQGRWGIGEKKEVPFKMASAFLKDRRDICVPVELLAGLIDEQSKLRSSARSWDMPDTVCSDLSWPGSCLENLSAGQELGLSSPAAPLLAHASGPENSHLALLRPRQACRGGSPSTPSGRNSGKGCVDGTADPGGPDVEAGAGSNDASAAIELKDRLALHAGPIRQISAVAPRANARPTVFVRCDYSATLATACKVKDRLDHLGGYNARGVYERRLRRAKVAAGLPVAADSAAAAPAARGGDDREGEEEESDFDGFEEGEKLVFSRRLTCVACSPFTPKNAAFLDEELRLFSWHSERGAVTHGAGPLPIVAPPGAPERPSLAAKVRRARNADVALDYGSHPRVLWVAGRHRAYRVDLRENPSPAALAPALDPGVYFTGFSDLSIVDGGPGRFGGRGEEPSVRSLAVGRRSAHDVFVAAGLHLACMDARFPKSVVARWDLPQEVDQLRWLPGVPGERAEEAEEIVLASGRRSPGFYVNTWARDVPGWRGYQARLGLDDTSPAASAARRPLTFSLPATPLSEGETRSGGLLLGLAPGGRGSSAAAVGDGLWFVHATSAGDAYGQRLEMRRVGGTGSGEAGGKKAVPASPRSALLSDRIQSMLPCGDVCLDPDAASYRRPPRPPASKKSSGAVAGGVATEVAGAGEKPPRRKVRGHDDGKDGVATGGNSSNDSSGSDDGRGSGRQGGSSRKDRRSHGGSRGAGEDCRDGGDSESSGGGESESRDGPEHSESEAGRSGTGDPRRRRRHRDDGRRDSGSSEEDGRASSGGAALSPRKPPARHGETPRKRTRTREGRGATSSDDDDGNNRDEGGSVGGKGRPGGPKAAVEYFPVNAGALCAAVEKVPENAICGHRYLAPLVALVSTGKGESGDCGGDKSAEGSSIRGAASEAAERRERDFSKLRDSKDRVAEFLLKPRTPDELLVFCRRTLGLEFPADDPPVRRLKNDDDDGGGDTKRTPSTGSRNTAGGGLRSSKSWSACSRGGGGGGSSSSGDGRARPRVEDATIMVDIARAVLAWGKPFRNVETAWRPAAVGQGYSVMTSRLPGPLPRVSAPVLCSAREVLKGEPSPFLRPGSVGPPLAVDVSVEDVRWLKDEWDSSW